MDRAEILKLLELPDNAGDLQIKKKFEERLSYYEDLSKNSPSAFLRKLNAQQLTKLELAKKDILECIQKIPVAEKPKQVQIKNADTENMASFTMPVILSSSARKEKKALPEVIVPVAFLILHTENQPVKSFELFSGKTFIGRKVHPALKPLIVLDDEYVSRLHAVIEIENDSNIYIDDSFLSNEGKPSKNGTFINGHKKRITSKTKINENDVIQVGETKLILKLNTRALDKIIDDVKDSEYMHTVVIRI